MKFSLWYRSQSHSPPIIMTTMTTQNLSDALTDQICKISKSDHDLIERDRQSIERSCLRSHCKRVWQQLTSDERDSIRQTVKKETAIFNQMNCYESSVDAHCIERMQELIRESGCYPPQTSPS